MDFKSRKGTMMVEAALIFPLVVAAVVAVIYMVIVLYSSLSLQASMHLDMRRESGEFTETVFRIQHTRDFKSTKGLKGIRPVIRMEEERAYGIGSLFRQTIIRTERGRVYIIDEAELTRILSEGGAET
jgi:hypothetical protein